MLNIYEYLDYRKFLSEWLKQQQSGGHGMKTKLAQQAGISSSMFSQVLMGNKELTLDQAAELIEMLALATHEEDFFLQLVELSRASNHKLKSRILSQLAEKKMKAQKLSERLKTAKELSELEKGIYYSSWIYGAVRNLSAIEEFGSTQLIADRLQIPVVLVSKVVEFLLENNLCIQHNGRLSPGVQNTYLRPESPMVNKHHQNWRVRGFDRMELKRTTDFFFTGPVTLASDDIGKVRDLLPKFVEEITKIVGPSKSEKGYCLNLDWFEW